MVWRRILQKADVYMNTGFSLAHEGVYAVPGSQALFPLEGEKADRHRRPDGGMDYDRLRMGFMGIFPHDGSFGGACPTLDFIPVEEVRT
jgi:hypothetical protein